MFVRLYLKSDCHMYTYESVNLIDISSHKFPFDGDAKIIFVEDGQPYEKR